jgi:hypothetical protein
LRDSSSVAATFHLTAGRFPTSSFFRTTSSNSETCSFRFFRRSSTSPFLFLCQSFITLDGIRQLLGAFMCRCSITANNRNRPDARLRSAHSGLLYAHLYHITLLYPIFVCLDLASSNFSSCHTHIQNLSQNPRSHPPPPPPPPPPPLTIPSKMR